MNARRYCALYVMHGIERQTAWFASRERALLALLVVRRRYGAACLYVD